MGAQTVSPSLSVRSNDRRHCVSHGRQISLVPILLALFVVPAQAHAQSESPSVGGAAVEWIRPEEVADRADALLRRLDAARADAAAAGGPPADRGRDRRAGPRSRRTARAGDRRDCAEGLARGYRGCATRARGRRGPAPRWKDELAAQAKRVAEILDELARGAARLVRDPRPARDGRGGGRGDAARGELAAGPRRSGGAACGPGRRACSR